MQPVAILAQYDHRDQAVVAEAVPQPHMQEFDLAASRQPLDLSLGQAAAGQVELVALVNELGDARQVQRVDHPDRPDHFEAGEVSGHVDHGARSEEHTSELQSLMRNSYAVLFL